MSALPKKFYVSRLMPSLKAQALRGEVLPAGAYNLRMVPNGTGHFDVYLDGGVLRAQLWERDALRVMALLREALRMEWSGRGQ